MRKSLAFAAILVGLFDSTYLTWAYTSEAHRMVCLGTGCDVVRSSAYAYPFGIPLPVFGLVFYGVLMLLALAETHAAAASGKIWRVITLVSGAGLLFSAWLTYLEAFVIDGWCVWCVVQAVAVAALFALSLSIVTNPPTPSGRRTRALRYSLLVVAIAVGIPSMLALTRQNETATASNVPVTAADGGELIRPDSHWTGNPNAPLTIVEFGDFQCPSCGMAERTNRAIRDQFGDKVKFVFRQFPLDKIHQYAFEAAEASECAGRQEKFWPMVETLYTNQSDLSEPSLKHYASELGLDQQKFSECLKDPSIAQRVRRDMADGNALNVRATPTFFLNGRKTEGGLSLMEVAGAISAASKEKPPNTSETGRNASNKEAISNKPEKPTRANSSASENSGEPSNASTSGATSGTTSGASFGFGGHANAFTQISGNSTTCDETEAAAQKSPPMVRTPQARQWFEKKLAVFVDIRPAEQFAQGRIPEAVNVPIDKLQKQMAGLAKDKSLVLYEGGGASGDPCALSKSAARILIAHGFKEVHVYQDGLAGWRKEGLPIQR